MKAELVAQAITEDISKTIISTAGGLTPEECVEALEIIEDFCGEWVRQLKSEHQL